MGEYLCLGVTKTDPIVIYKVDDEKVPINDSNEVTYILSSQSEVDRPFRVAFEKANGFQFTRLSVLNTILSDRKIKDRPLSEKQIEGYKKLKEVVLRKTSNNKGLEEKV